MAQTKMATQNNFLAAGRRDVIKLKPAAALCGFMLAALRLSSADAGECADLKSLALPRTQITFAGVVNAGAFSPPAGGNGSAAATAAYARLPSFCRVAGTVRPTPDSDIRFEVWMPTAGWNRKFVSVGNGAWAGSIVHASMIDPLSKGYATAATDGGHQGDPLDASFAAGHPEKLLDFGYRAPHEMTIAAKAVVASFYGKVANRSLFASCSTGGRQALMEAYRYPEDYDAISSMAPANPVVGLMVGSLWTGSATAKNAASTIPPAKFEMLHKAAVKA